MEFVCYSPAVPATATERKRVAPRHAAIVRVTHWITTISTFALLLTGAEILISHPRFYWGEVGNVMTRPLFTLPIPASRDTVPTGYHFVMPDQNGWSRYLHFEAAWVAVLTALIYGIWGLWSGHFWRDLVPRRGERTWRAFWQVIGKYLRRAPPESADAEQYNVVQRTAYLSVIFVLFPLLIWTGLAMSPSFTSAFPATAALLGGRQSARTLHFFLSGLLLLFIVVHVTMVALAGFWGRLWPMIFGRRRGPAGKERV